MHTITETVRAPELPGPRGSRGGTELRSLLHDLGHGLATLSYIADGLRADPALPGEALHRLQLMELELDRLLELVDLREQPREDGFALRELLTQLVAVKSLRGPAEVVLLEGAEVTIRTDQTLLWRMVSNLLDNAVRAAGSRVTVAVRESVGELRVEITDDGPGFGRGPRGMASLGLSIVVALARRCGAELRVDPAPGGGTCARLVFPSHLAR